jgi:hypothetical protein
MAILLGIVVLLVANMTAVPTLGGSPCSWLGSPPVALLLSGELLGHHRSLRESAETGRLLATSALDGHGRDKKAMTISQAAVSERASLIR